MMKQIWDRFCNFSFFVQVIIILCVLGFLVNAVLVWRDLHGNGILLRLHAGFLVLYLTQIIFIFLYEKYVAVLTVLQGILALLTNGDFIFIPLLKVLGQFYYLVHEPRVDEFKVYKYVFMSLAFTLQMFSAYVLFAEISFWQKKNERSASLPQESSAESSAC